MFYSDRVCQSWSCSYFTGEMSVFVIPLSFFSKVLSWLSPVGKRWCHVFLCSNQDLAKFESKPDDSCGLFAYAARTVNHIRSHHTHKTLMISCRRVFGLLIISYLVTNIQCNSDSLVYIIALTQSVEFVREKLFSCLTPNHISVV